LEEYEDCVDFQEEIWGRGFSEKVSAAILMIANRVGGLAAGAYDADGVLQGFVFGLTGVVEGELVHWSDMLAVRDSGRDRGLGTFLKWYQRGVMLERGVRQMRWTFDPLQGRNAYVNFAKLGIVSREYVVNMYGLTDSPLHRGMDTDRLVATWEMDSGRVESRAHGEQPAKVLSEAEWTEIPQALSLSEKGAYPFPGAPALGRTDRHLLIAVPANIDTVIDEALDVVLRWREATRAVFTDYLSRGYQVTEFFRRDSASFYLLEAVGNHGSGAGPKAVGDPDGERAP
jgi:predicted GNAT superfamily acetyltransferase